MRQNGLIYLFIIPLILIVNVLSAETSPHQEFKKTVLIAEKASGETAGNGSNGYVENFKTSDNKASFTVEYSETPDLKPWIDVYVIPEIIRWYPKICELLKVPGSTARSKFRIKFTKDYQGVAVTSEDLVSCDIRYYRKSKDIGSIVHEIVHVIQKYPPAEEGYDDFPLWLIEGIADYVRWHIYETPAFKVTAQNIVHIRCDQSYQVTADFLKWIGTRYGEEILYKIHIAGSTGQYKMGLWKRLTSYSLIELEEQWISDHAIRIGVPSPKN